MGVYCYIIENDLVKGYSETDDDTVLSDSRYVRAEDVFAVIPELRDDPFMALNKVYQNGALSDNPNEAPTFEEIKEQARLNSRTTVFTVTEFKTLFTIDEKAAIYASTDPVVKVFLSDLETANSVDTADQRTIAGVQYLAGTGVIAANREAEILVDHLMGEVIYPPSN